MSQNPPPSEDRPDGDLPPNRPPGYTPNTQPPGYPPNQPGPYGPPPSMSPEDEKLWSTLTHIGGIFFSFVVPLITYLVLRDRGPFVRAHTAAALNFQLTMLIAAIVSIFLWIIVIGILLTIALAIVVVVFSIIAAVAANKGQYYRYPLTIQFVS